MKKQKGKLPVVNLYLDTRRDGHIERIFRVDKSSLKYSIAIVHLEGKWYGLYTGGGNINDWDIGEVKAELTETKSDKIFICTWYGLGKTKIDSTSIIFDDENSFTLKNDLLSDKYVRIK